MSIILDGSTTARMPWPVAEAQAVKDPPDFGRFPLLAKPRQAYVSTPVYSAGELEVALNRAAPQPGLSGIEPAVGGLLIVAGIGLVGGLIYLAYRREQRMLEGMNSGDRVRYAQTQALAGLGHAALSRW